MNEIAVVLLLALIFLGPKMLPDIASGVGKVIREVRKATGDIKNEIQLDDAIRKPFEELREAMVLPPEELKRRDEEKAWREKWEREERERQAREAAEAGAAGGTSNPDATMISESPSQSPTDHAPSYASDDAAAHGDRTIAMEAPTPKASADVVPPPVAPAASPPSAPVPPPIGSAPTIAAPAPPPGFPKGPPPGAIARDATVLGVGGPAKRGLTPPPPPPSSVAGGPRLPPPPGAARGVPTPDKKA